MVDVGAGVEVAAGAVAVEGSGGEAPAPGYQPQPVRSEPVGIGKIIDGKYRVDALIGEGGMGVVWKATQLDLERPVAIKVVRDEYASNEEVVNRTLLEAKAAAKLRGEHIVRVLDVGKLPTGAPYIVMEYLEGRDLYADLTRWVSPMPIHLVVDLVLEACEGLAEAHAAGIVHRDLKPENLFIAEQPDGSAVVKILDFGISKETCADATRAVTNPASAMGSPQYMAPEQMRGAEDVDARADIWSLGATLYELLVGRSAFHGANIPAVCSMVLEGEPIRPRLLRPEIPVGLEAVVLRCLKKQREERFGSIGELANALAMYGSVTAGDRAARIARVISGIRPRYSYPGERFSEMPTLRESAFDNLNSLAGNAAPVRTNRPPDGARWPVALLSAALALPVGFGVATGVTSLQEWLTRASEASARETVGSGAEAVLVTPEPRRGFTLGVGAPSFPEEEPGSSADPEIVVMDPIVFGEDTPESESRSGGAKKLGASKRWTRLVRKSWRSSPASGVSAPAAPRAEPRPGGAATSAEAPSTEAPSTEAPSTEDGNIEAPIAEAPNAEASSEPPSEPAAETPSPPPEGPEEAAPPAPPVPSVTGPSAWDPKSFGGRR
jgi:serine/threonine protein kinase